MTKKGKAKMQEDAQETETQRSVFFKKKTMVILFYSGFMAVLSYYMYDLLWTHPDLPLMDINQWWGPYPLDQSSDTSIRTYMIQFDDVMVNDLQQRLLHRRPFVPPLEDAGFKYGFNTHFLGQVLDYWENKYNFQEREDFLNRYNHFKTQIQGLDIHFMRVTSTPSPESGVTVVPLLMLHGFPGSFREFYEMIPLLTKPRPEYNFVFDVIVPSLPGFGFSDGAARSGLGPAEMAVVMHNLMTRIGYDKYYVHGGDVGHWVGSAMATLFPDNILGFHTSTPVVWQWTSPLYYLLGAIFPSFIMEHPELHSRMYPLWDKVCYLWQETGYYHIQASKPDTIGIALTDSPAGLAAYILEKFSAFTNPEYIRASDGNLLHKFALTHLLDNVMIYWASNSITTSVRVFKEANSVKSLAMQLDDIPTPVPTAGIKFKHDLIYVPDKLLSRKYTHYVHSTVVEEGGRLAAMESPDVLADDIFQAVERFFDFDTNRNGLSLINPGNPEKQFDETAKTINPGNPEKQLWETAKTIYEFTAKDINGKEVSLARYKGHVTIIVNVASECGFTNINYKQLNELYEKYSKTKGLRIAAFPCNQFGGQEPGSPQDIFNFAKDRGVKFDLYEKVQVNGEDAHPLFKFLKRAQEGTLVNSIKWNFSKFIIDKNGVPVERLATTVNPVDMVPYLEKYW